MSVTDLRDETAGPTFPPLFSGLAVTGAADPFEHARAQAVLGCDAGLVVHRITSERLQAAIVFAPENPLRDAIVALIACGVGFQNALGALAPPEVAVQLTWDGRIHVNGATCGRFRVAAPDGDPEAEPDWLIIGIDLPLSPPDGVDPGIDPTATTLFEEGCADVSPVTLLEAWVRHTLYWITRMIDEGNRPLHSEWRGLALEIGEDVRMAVGGTTQAGTFLGVDESFGMLLRTSAGTQVIPLTALLEDQ